MQALSDIQHDGGIILDENRLLGYMHVWLPPSGLPQLLARAEIRSSNIDSANFISPREEFYLKPGDVPPPQGVPRHDTFTIPIPHVARSFGRAPQRFFPAEEAGLDALRSIDGNGQDVHIGLNDTGIDLLHPSFQRVDSIDNRVVPKVTAVIATGTINDNDIGWVKLRSPQAVYHRRLRAFGRLWKVPHDGDYRIGWLIRRVPTSGFTTPPTSYIDLSAAVLTDWKLQTAWVDTNGNGDFSDERALHEYRSPADIGWFGRIRGDQDDRIPFAVHFDLHERALKILIADPHGSIVASTMAANRLTGGLFDGAAPDAHIVEVYDNTNSSNIDAGLLTTLARPDVDLVSVSAGRGWAGTNGEFDRNLFSEASHAYGKLVMCLCAFSGGINVEDYQSTRELRLNRGLQDITHAYFHGFVFPRTADGLYNTIYAPSVSLIAENRFDPEAFPSKNGLSLSAGDVPEPYAPAGYGVGANNSPTISLVSGIVADLVGLARKYHISYTPSRMREALFLSARHASNVPAWLQGVGVIDGGAAWRLLQRLAILDHRYRGAIYFDVISADGTSFKPDAGPRMTSRVAGASQHGVFYITRRGGSVDAVPLVLTLSGDRNVTVWPTHIVSYKDRAMLIHYRTRTRAGLSLTFIKIGDGNSGTPMQLIPFSYISPDFSSKTTVHERTYRRILARRSIAFVADMASKGSQLSIATITIPVVNMVGPEDFLSFFETPLELDLMNPDVFAPTSRIDPAMNHVTGYGSTQLIRQYIIENKAGMSDVKLYFLSNRGYPEYETPAFPPPPNRPIVATLNVKDYSAYLAFSRDFTGTAIHAAMTGVSGIVRVVALGVTKKNSIATISRGYGHSDFSLSRDATDMRVDVHFPQTHGQFGTNGLLVVVHCTQVRASCSAIGSATLRNGSATLAVQDASKGAYTVLLFVPLFSQAHADVVVTIVGMHRRPLEAWSERHEGEQWSIGNVKPGDAVALELAEDSALNPSAAAYLPTLMPSGT